MRKKSKCPKKNFQSVKKGGKKKCKCRISGVRKKNERKVPEKKSKYFGWKFKVKGFAKFVFTGWALC